MFIYDIEIKHGVLPENYSDRKINIQYCAGWNDYKNMGIACVGVYDYTKDVYRIFGEKELDELQKLIDLHDCAVGFNNIGFDNNVLRAFDVTISDSKSYDILQEIYRSLGSRQKGCKLDNVVKANFSSAGKTGDGAMAPVLWQQGYQTKVIDYCLNDVRMTKMLTDKILRYGYLTNPINQNNSIKLKRP